MHVEQAFFIKNPNKRLYFNHELNNPRNKIWIKIYFFKISKEKEFFKVCHGEGSLAFEHKIKKIKQKQKQKQTKVSN